MTPRVVVTVLLLFLLCPQESTAGGSVDSRITYLRELKKTNHSGLLLAIVLTCHVALLFHLKGLRKKRLVGSIPVLSGGSIPVLSGGSIPVLSGGSIPGVLSGGSIPGLPGIGKK